MAAVRGAKHVPCISKGQHEKVTVVACASAARKSLPPMFIFKNPNGRVPYRVQEVWLDRQRFLFEVVSRRVLERPALLIIDGHKAHVTLDVIELAARNNILVFCLPAHASHLLQPLDLSLFGLLKKGQIRACAAFHHLTSVVVNQRNFAKIFNITWHSSSTPDVIRGGFQKWGILETERKEREEEEKKKKRRERERLAEELPHPTHSYIPVVFFQAFLSCV